MTGQAPENLTSMFITRGNVSGRIIKPGAFSNLTFLFKTATGQQTFNYGSVSMEQARFKPQIMQQSRFLQESFLKITI